MSTTVYKFEDRLIVKEVRAVESRYIGSGVPVRIGQIRRVEDVLSVDNDYAQYGLLTPLSEVRVSNNNIFVVMRRGDLGTLATTSGQALSGIGALALMSGITSGLAPFGELVSGILPISGKVTVYATVVGY